MISRAVSELLKQPFPLEKGLQFAYIGFVQERDELEFGALAARLPLPMGEVPAGRRGPSQSASLTALP